MKKILIFLFLFTFSWATFPKLTGMVMDEAGILDKKSFLKIKNLVNKEREQSGVEIVVLIQKSNEVKDFSMYTTNLGRHWGIGEKGKDNGILMLVALKERKVWISTGYGIETVLTDALVRNIIEKDIVPNFKTKDYGEGIEKAVESIIKVLHNEYDTLGIIMEYFNNSDFYFLELEYDKYEPFDLMKVDAYFFVLMTLISSALLFVLALSVERRFFIVFFGVLILYCIVLWGILKYVDNFEGGILNYILSIIGLSLAIHFAYKYRNFEYSKANKTSLRGYSSSSYSSYSSSSYSGGGGSFGGGGAGGSW